MWEKRVEFKILLQLRVAEVCLRKQMWIIPLTRHHLVVIP